MKLNILFSIACIVGVSFLELGCYAISSNKYSPFFFRGSRNELPSELYGKLDPLLGYTFNREVEPSEFESQYFLTLDKSWATKGSYFLFEFRPLEKGIRILILGGSATDSNLYNGNWPYFLHKLMKKRGIPHTIFNGAVSGYSTNQELIKFQRDFQSFDQLDVVIAYNGVNDTLVNNDIVSKYPWVHPYEYRLYTEMSGRRIDFVRPTLLPNFRNFLNNLWPRKVVEIDLGTAEENYVERFELNVDLLRTAALKKGASFLHVLQPIGWTSDLYANEFSESRDEGFLNSVGKFYKKVRETNSHELLDMTKVLDFKKGKYFLDYIHLNDRGNEVVSQAIIDRLNAKGYLE